MPTTANFDTAGISNGKDINQLYQTADTLITAYLITLLGRYKDKPLNQVDWQQWQNTMLNNIPKLDKQIDLVARKAYKEAEIIIEKDIKDSYISGNKEAKRQIEKLGKDIKQLSTPNIEKSENIQQERQTALQALSSASTTAKRIARDNALKTINAVALIGSARIGNTLHEVIDRVTQPIIVQGNTAKVTSNGQQLSLAGYTSAVIRETSHKSYMAGSGEMRSSYGLNLVVVSTHASSCELCRPWEGKILIDDRFANTPMTSTRYKRLSEAIEAGLYHFNCRHGLSAYVPGTKKPEVPKNTPETARLKKLTYEIEQKQRVLQRDIRNAKKIEANSLTEAQKIKAKETIRRKQANIRDLEKKAKNLGVPFYRQNWREQITFEFKTFKPELIKLNIKA